MKKRIVPVVQTLDDHQDCSVGSSSKSTRSRIRLRRPSSKSSSSNANKTNRRQQKFIKQPFLHKSTAAEQNSPSKQTRSSTSSTAGNGTCIHFNDLISDHKYLENPVHWINWIDSGMELLGCGISTSNPNTGLLPLNADEAPSSSQMKSKNSDKNNSNTQWHHWQSEKDVAAAQKRHQKLMERDYIQLHEDFFDSLLKEEGDKMLASIVLASGSASVSVSLQQTESLPQSRDGTAMNRVGSSCHSTTSAVSSVTNASGISAINDSRSRGNSNSNDNLSPTATTRNNHCWENGEKKKRRRRTGTTTSSIEEYDRLYNPDSSLTIAQTNQSSFTKNDSNRAPSILCIKDIMARQHSLASGSYIHPNCRLQKDKGKGDRLESSISATGREPCLEKLRDKIKLIIEVSGELQAAPFIDDAASVSSLKSKNNVSNSKYNSTTSNNKGMSAGMKRRKARIASIENNSSCSNGRDDGSCIIETRSMIELQLGFLSMQYGLLLRWDAYQTGQIIYVCLRKMCHDSFYSKIPPSPVITTRMTKAANNEQSSTGPPRIIADAKKRETPSPLVVRSRKGCNNAIYQRASGATEVVLVDAPYRVPQPEVFAPSVLTLDLHALTGLDPKSRWTLSCTFDGHTEIAHLNYNKHDRVFQTTRTLPCKWEMQMVPHRPVTSFDVASGLEIRLFEQRPKHRLRGVASVGEMVRRSSSSSSTSLLVPPGKDPFSLTTPSNSYIIQNQRLTHYTSSSHNSGTKIFSNESSSVGSSNSVAGSISSWNSSKKSTSRLASTMTVPLGGLLSQPSTSQTAYWKLAIPFTHNDNAQVNLTLTHQSDYAHWLYRELRARRKEESTLVSANSNKNSSDLWHRLTSSKSPHNDQNSDGGEENKNNSDDSDLYFMDWFVYCC